MEESNGKSLSASSDTTSLSETSSEHQDEVVNESRNEQRREYTEGNISLLQYSGRKVYDIFWDLVTYCFLMLNMIFTRAGFGALPYMKESNLALNCDSQAYKASTKTHDSSLNKEDVPGLFCQKGQEKDPDDSVSWLSENSTAVVSRANNSSGIPWKPSRSVLALKSKEWNEGLQCIMSRNVPQLKQYSRNKEFQSALTVWRNRYGETLLHVICRRGFDDVLGVLLEAVPNSWLVNSGRARETGMLPLHSSAASGHPKCVKLLVEKGGAEVRDQFDCYGLTPLHHAAIGVSKGAGDCAKILLDAGADLLAKDQSLQTPWHKAVFHGNLPVLQIFESYVTSNDLIEELQANDRYSALGKTSLYLAAKYVTMDDGYIAETIVSLLSQRLSFDVNVRSFDDQHTPLHDAALAGNVGAVKGLLRAGADINAVVPSDLSTPLHLAVRGNHSDVVRVLLENSWIRKNMTDIHGNTPQKLAVKENHFSAASLFLDESIAKKRVQNRKAQIALASEKANPDA